MISQLLLIVLIINKFLKQNFMKSIIKSLIVLAAGASMAFASIASAAAFNGFANDLDVLHVTTTRASNSSWAKTATVNDGDIVSFNIYYHVTSQDAANDVKARITNLTSGTVNGSKTVTGTMSAANAASVSGSVSINTSEEMEFTLYKVMWQPNKCNVASCAQQVLNSPSSVLSSGASIGTIQGVAGLDSSNNFKYQGNVVVEFKANAVEDTPVFVAPTVDTRTESNVTTTSGVMNGSVDLSTSVDSGIVYFIWGTSSSNLQYTTPSQSVSSDQNFNQAVSGLQDDTTYYYRAVLRGDDGQTYTGDLESFRTDADSVFVAPTVDTRTESNVDTDSATLNGSVDLSTSVDSGIVYFIWGTSSSNLQYTTPSQSVSSDQNFNQAVSGLQDDTTYYYRAVLRGDDGQTYTGDLESFRTDADNPTSNNVDIDTNAASSIDDDSARLNGDVEEGDNQDVWFAFSRTDSTPSCSSSSQRVDVSGVYDSNEDFSAIVRNLIANETYYFRACTLDENGEVLSAQIRQFTTDEEDNGNNNDPAAEVDTNAATSVDEDSARLNGDLEEGDNATVWFAISSVDTTPSCSSSLQRVSVSGVYDQGDDFSRIVTGLSENTKYYFRSCALGEDGDTVSGSIRTFVTDEDDNPTNPPTSVNPDTITRLPSGITSSTATLNSYVIGNGTGTCYFQYGTSAGFGSVTPAQTVNLDNTSTCSSTRFNLQPNTTYYYRSVLVDGGQTYYGLTRSFRTNANAVVTTPSTPTVVTTPTRVITRTVTAPAAPVVDDTVTVRVVEETTRVADQPLEITKWVSAETDPEFVRVTEADRDEAVFYKVRVTNNTDEDLEDVVVIDRIPFDLELDGQESLDDDSYKEVRWNIRSLEAGESKTFITEMRVRDDVDFGDRIDSYATAFNDEYNVDSNNVVIEIEEERVASASDEEVDGSQAASIFGAGFFPTTLLGWLILLAIVLAIAYLVSRIFFSRNENERVLAELRAMQQVNRG